MSAVSPAAPSAHAAALYERHRLSVLRFCHSRLGSREEAEDATQTTFLNAVRALSRGTVPRSESAWLLRIAENVCRGRHRTASRRREAACDPTVLEDVLTAPPGRPDELVHLTAALESLPERQRRAVLLREWQGLSYDEIGAELGLSHSAVETLLFRARRGLARALDEGGRKRHGLGLLAWVKTAFGGGAGVKIAAAVVVAGVAVVPAAREQARLPETSLPAPARPAAASPAPSHAARPAPAPVAAPTSARPAQAVVPAPTRKRTARAVHGGRPAATDDAPAPTAAPRPKEDGPAAGGGGGGGKTTETPRTEPPRGETPRTQSPTVTVPSVSTPSVSTPPVSTPPVTTPPVTTPSVTTPSLTVPSVTTPPVAVVPGVEVPAVTVPEVTVPSVTVPSVTVPSVTVPPVTVPPLPLPLPRLP